MDAKGVIFAEKKREKVEVEVEEEEEVEGFDDEDEEEEEAIDDDDYDDDEEDSDSGWFMPSPLVPLKYQIEKDKEDESLRKWKETLLGDVEGEIDSEIEPKVIFHSIGIVSDGCEEMVIPLPMKENQNTINFTLKEGANYRLKLTFSVHHNIVSGLTYKNTVWKGRRKVEQMKGMLGSFAPRANAYEEMLEVETAPSGLFARGMYSAELEFGDDDNDHHLELKYSFQIKKH